MRALIIEDEKNLAESLREKLESECFVVDVAFDGEMGLSNAKLNDYDLVLLDNILPQKDGFQVCQEIRKNGKTFPIIVLSVKSDTSSKVELLNIGADDYIAKPFSFEELLARIHAVMRRPKLIEGEILKIGDLVLDSQKQVVTKNDKEVYLTKKEFILLKYLMRNPGIVLSRNMIMEHVWDADADPFSNTIEMHILNLRKKVGSINGKGIIHTIPGRGYKIEL